MLTVPDSLLWSSSWPRVAAPGCQELLGYFGVVHRCKFLHPTKLPFVDQIVDVSDAQELRPRLLIRDVLLLHVMHVNAED